MKTRKLTSKLMAIVLSVTMLLSSVQLESLAANFTSTNDTLAETKAVAEATVSDDTEEVYIIAELCQERTETTKMFRMSDGSYSIALYDQPIHFENEQGEFEEIDNTFISSEHATVSSLQNSTDSTTYTSRAGNTKITFAEKSGVLTEQVKLLTTNETNSKANHTVSMEINGQVVSWFYEGISAGEIEWIEKGSDLDTRGDDRFLTVSTGTSFGEYQDAFAHTDLQYFISPEGIKENIILKDKRAQNSWTLQVNIGTFTAIQKDEQTVELRDKDDKTVIIISAPLMWDSENRVNNDVILDMSVFGSTMSLTIIADKEFLQDEDTVYPVTIDPYFYVVSSSDISISDTFLSSSKPTTSMRSNGMAVGSLMVGRESSTYGKTRSLLKLNTLPSLPAGTVITEAKLMLKNYYSYSANNSMIVEVRKATGAWTQGAATWNNSSTLYDNDIQDYCLVPQNESPTNIFDSWDITRLMKGWYEGSIPNHGLMLTALAAETSSPAHCTKYYSSNSPSYQGLYPTFIITFRNNAGFEDYWTYHTQTVNGGVGYVNDYSGNLIFTIPIAETTGLNMPAAYSFIYNSYISDQLFRNKTKGSVNGAGWMTSFSQRLEHINNMTEYSDIADALIAQGFDYVWLDTDGTHHFLKRESNGIYKDEDGLGLTMKTGQSYSTYTNLNIMEDKEGNKAGFKTNGNLIYQSNHLGQTISYTYENNNLSRVTDGAGRNITFHYTDSFVTTVTAPNGTTTFEYSGNNLSKINFSDGTNIELNYSIITIAGKTYNLLNSIKGKDGCELVYEYANSGTAQQRCRVSQVTEYSSAGNIGNRISIDYSLHNCTKFTYTRNDSITYETYQFNNWGHTTDAVGPDGSSIYIRRNVSSGGALNNKITVSNPVEKYVNNLMVDHSIEEGRGWASFWESGTNMQLSVDNTTAYLGHRSFKVYQNSVVPKSGSWRQPITIDGGKDYTFSVYVKTEDIVAEIKGASIWVYLYRDNTQVGRANCDVFLTGDNDWTRLHVSFTSPITANKAYVCGGISGGNGTAWFDCFQLEENTSASTYNLVENSSFDAAKGWTYTDADGTAKTTGSPTLNKMIWQKVYIGKVGVAFQMRALAKAVAAPITNGSGRFAAICIQTNYTDGTHDSHHAHINTGVSEWQSVNLTVAPKQGNESKTIDSITVFLLYYKQVNTIYFDDIVVNVDETGTTYAYDNDGNLISSADNARRKTTYTIDSATDMVTTATDPTNTTYSYTYDSVNEKQLVAAKENSTGIGFEYTYGTGNNVGNVEKLQMGTVTQITDNPYVEVGTEYTDNGAYVKSETDQRGKCTQYTVDSSTGIISAVTAPSQTTTNYTYDETTKQLTGVSKGDSAVTYLYDDASTGNRLAGITNNNSSYSFIYDEWYNLQRVKIGNYILNTNTYAANNGNLLTSTYGNGHCTQYVYDEYDRVVAKKENIQNSAAAIYTARYVYNTNGLLARIVDELNGYSSNYTYDISERLTLYQNQSGTIAYSYDNQNRTTKTTLGFDGVKYSTNFSYLSANRLGTTTLPVGKVERTYDELQRETVHKVYSNSNSENHLRSETTYVNLDENRTTQLVSEYNHYVGTSDSDKNVLDGYTSFTYTYDDNGNISSIVEKAGNATRTRTYEYDALNQLVRENDEAQGKSITYSYDNCGNLLSKTEYMYTNGTLGTAINTFYYSYENSEWKDLLTRYEGQSITYDAIGNPLMYYDGTSFTWTQGRRLSSTTLSDGTVITYKYDTQGRRIGKVVGETETEYFVDDVGTVYAMKQGEEKLVFMYDATGRREGFRWYTGTQDNGAYYYVYNLQGDVIGIVASDLELVVLYEYDSWGKVLNVSGTKATTLGQINPFCYRGYCYDAETGFYYVTSRYYDPGTGRFINADNAIAGVGGNVKGYNLYSYCFNNPINMSDPTGNWPQNLGDLLVKVVARVIVTTVKNHIVNAVNKRKINKEIQTSYSKETAKEDIDEILHKYGDDVNATFNDSGVEIENSIKVNSRYDRQKISTIITRTESVTKREYDDLSAEWLFHNIAYALHVKRNSAISANLDYTKDSRWYVICVTDLLEIFGLE